MSFAHRIKQLVSETAIYGLSSILGRMIGYLLVPFYTWYFVPDEYGVVIAVYAAFVFLNIVYTYGMESAYLKFASGSKGRNRTREVFSTATISLVLTSLALSLVLVVFREPFGTLITLDRSWLFLINYAVVILVLDTLVVVPLAELRLQNRAWRFALTRVAGILVNVSLNVFFIAALGMHIDAILLANVISSGVVFLLLLPIYFRSFRLAFSRGVYAELLRFGLPFLPSGLGYALTEIVSRFFIGHMSRERVIELYGDRLNLDALAEKADRAAEAVRQSAIDTGDPLDSATTFEMAEAAESVYGSHILGVFGTCYKLAIFMMLVVQMFRYAWQPFFLQQAESPDAKALFARVFTLFTALGLFVFLAVSFFVYEIVAFPLPGVGYLIEPSYWLGLHIVPVLLLAYLFQGWYFNFSAGLYIEKRTRYFVHNTLLGGGVTLLLNILFVSHYGMIAAAWATAAAYLTMAVALFATARRYYPIRYEWGRILRMSILAGGLFVIWHEAETLQVWWAQLGLLSVYLIGLLVLRIVGAGSLKHFIQRST